MYEDEVEIEASDITNFLEEFFDLLRPGFSILFHDNVVFEIFYIIRYFNFIVFDIEIDWHLQRVCPVLFISIHLLFFYLLSSGKLNFLFFRPDC